MAMYLWALYLFALFPLVISSLDEDTTNINTTSKLKASLDATDKILKKLFDRWQIDRSPNFLNSVTMSLTAWEVLRAKFESKILTSLTQPINVTTDKKNSVKFVMSFMGSR